MDTDKLWTAVESGHTLTFKLTGIMFILYVDGMTSTVDIQDHRMKLKLALAARQLWREVVLRELPPGVYACAPRTLSRRKVFLSAGWEELPYKSPHLVYYHQAPTRKRG